MNSRSGHIPIIARWSHSLRLWWHNYVQRQPRKFLSPALRARLFNRAIFFVFDFVLRLRSNFQKRWEPIATPQELRRVTLPAVKWQVSHIHKGRPWPGGVSHQIFIHLSLSFFFLRERTCWLTHWALANSATPHLVPPLISTGEPKRKQLTQLSLMEMHERAFRCACGLKPLIYQVTRC